MNSIALGHGPDEKSDPELGYSPAPIQDFLERRII